MGWFLFFACNLGIAKKKKKLQSGETFCTTWFTESQALLVLMKIKTSLQGKAFFSGTWLVGVDVSI